MTNLSTFLASIHNPRARGAARKTLARSIRYRGTVTSRSAMVERVVLVDGGYRVIGEGEHRRLTTAGGIYLAQGSGGISATMMDYAAFLCDQLNTRAA